MSEVYGYSGFYHCYVIDPYYIGKAGLQFSLGNSPICLPALMFQKNAEGELRPIRGALFASFKGLMGDNDLTMEDYAAVRWLWSKHFTPYISLLHGAGAKRFGQCQWLPPTPFSDISEVIEGVRFITQLRKLELDE